MAKRDYYQVLGVSRDATAAQIRSAYRKLARRYHPDVNKAPDATEKFNEATEAYEALSDTQKRKLYDQFGHAGPQAGARPGGRGYRVHAAASGPPFDFEELFSGLGGRRGGGFTGMSLEDILAALGGGRAARRRKRADDSRKGADLEYPVTLDFLQAVRGVTTTIRLRRGEPPIQAATETIEVKIPPGVQQDQRIRLRGKGQAGPGGYGDLYIRVHIAGHPYFRREGRDVYVELPISLSEAALGAKVDVPTIDGMTTVTIPPGTSGSRKLRLKGQGVPAAGQDERGDQYVIVRIVVPPSLSSRGRELLEQFAETEAFDPRANVAWK